MRVRKAVIPAAGLGTRFLPITKAVPKEMLPIVDVPTIQLIVEEAVAAGIEEIVLVTGRGKSAVEDYFDHAFELESRLEQAGKEELFASLRRIAGLARIVSVRQKSPLGLGHAVLCARAAVGDEPFAVLLGDDVFDAQPPAIAQCITLATEIEHAVVGVMEVERGQEHLYGIVSARADEKGLRVQALVEKPPAGSATSRLAIPGRYVLTPEVWDILEHTSPGRGGEIQLTDALVTLAQRHGLYARVIAGDRYDCGDRVGYLHANLAYALKRPELADAVRALCRKLGQ